MSHSPLISKSMLSKERNDNDDPYSPLYVENLLGVNFKFNFLGS